MTAMSASQTLTGLSSEEAARRLAEGRGNAVPWTTSRSFRRILLDNAVTPVNVVLFAISGVLLVLGLFGDAVLTGGLVLGNIIVGVFQETRAKRQLDRIALLNQPESTVIRDAEERFVRQQDVVEGDLLVLNPGDQVPVDGRVIVSRGLGVDESLLTGESEIVSKREGDALVSGSFCVAGSGVCEATNVGAAAAANEFTARARAYRAPLTPLQREVGLIIWAMSLVVVFLSAEVIRSLSATGNASLSETVRAAAVIVALVPQGLAVMTTVSYAMAAVRLTGTGILIQRMNAVESISHVDVLCFDKTGTITTNRLNIEAIVPLQGDEESLRRILGDFAASAGYANRTLDAVREALQGSARPVKHEVPFDSSRKWSALALEGDGAGETLVLGAPEVLADRCPDAASLRTRAEAWASKGLRVLLFAAAAGEPPPFGDLELPAALRPLGFIVLSDEVRPDAGRVAAEFAAAGIDLKIISGDHPETVATLAAQAGIGGDGGVVSGSDIDAADEAALERIAAETRIFGRVTPQGKEAIVRALRRQGRYVAMIGDGVNDVPALKAAQVAVSVRSGSAMTRSVADIVLLRDEFSKLPSAFAEGQRIRKGMEGIFRVFLSRTLSLTLIVLCVSLLNDPFPVSPRHTALIAMLTVGIPSIGLALWARPGRTGRTLILSATRFVVPAAAGIAAVGLVAYEFFLSSTDDVDQARTALTLTATLCGLLLILFLEPPTPAWAGASPVSGDWRPTALAVALFVAFIVIARTADTRDFYELELPDVWGLIAVAALVFAWAMLLRAFWRLDLHALPGRLKRRVQDALGTLGQRRQ